MERGTEKELQHPQQRGDTHRQQYRKCVIVCDVIQSTLQLYFLVCHIA